MRRYFIVRTRENVEDFVRKGVSAIGWSVVDLSRDINFDELWKEVEEKCYPEGSSGRIKGRAKGELTRYKSIQPGDIVLVPTYKGFYMGEAVKLGYHQEYKKEDLANQVNISFKKDNSGDLIKFSRDEKLTDISRKLGARYTVLEITNPDSIEDIEKLYETGIDYSHTDFVENEERRNEEIFRDSLLKVIKNNDGTSINPNGRGFEELIAEIMKQDGFETYIFDKRIGGSGIADADVLAVKRSSLGRTFTSAFVFQAKHYQGESNDGIDQIIEFKKQITEKATEGDHSISFTMYDGKTIELYLNQIKYVLVSSGSFKNDAMEKAEDNDIILIDGDDLSEMLYRVIEDMPEIRKKLGFIKNYQRYPERNG